MKKKLLIVMLAVCLFCSAIFMVSCSKPDDTNKPTPEPEKPAETTTFTFAGNATIGGTVYNVKLIGKSDKTFKLKPNDTIKPIEGSYELVAKKGYIFTFKDTGATVVKTSFDATKKEFSAVYNLKISETAKGNVTLIYKDTAFDYDGIGFVNASPIVTKFTGSVNAMNTEVIYTLNLKADKSFELISSVPQFVPTRTGAYTFAGDKYKITFDDENEAGKVFESTKADGIYTIVYKFKGRDATVTVNLTFAPTFIGTGSAMGMDVTFTLALKADKTVALSSTVSQFIPTRTGTFTFANDEYTITLSDANALGTEFKSSKIGSTYKIAYKYKGGEAEISADLTYTPAV